MIWIYRHKHVRDAINQMRSAMPSKSFWRPYQEMQARDWNVQEVFGLVFMNTYETVRRAAIRPLGGQQGNP